MYVCACVFVCKFDVLLTFCFCLRFVYLCVYVWNYYRTSVITVICVCVWPLELLKYFPYHDVCVSCVCCAADLLFVQGTEVIFKVALCLLSSHEGEIVECDSFETIVDYLKTSLPSLSQAQMEHTISKVCTHTHTQKIIYTHFMHTHTHTQMKTCTQMQTYIHTFKLTLHTHTYGHTLYIYTHERARHTHTIPLNCRYFVRYLSSTLQCSVC